MNLSVALLLSEMTEVKEISAVFRKLGIIPHFYEDLATFWTGTLEKTPALCVVDVKLMSDGKLILKDHPLVQSEQLPLLFYYTELSEPLLFSTYELFHLGTLKKTAFYEGALKAILKRINRFMNLERDNLHLKMMQTSQLDKIFKLEERVTSLQQEDKYRSMATTLITTLENSRGEVDFFTAITKVFDSISEIAEYAFVELSFNGQKLISPTSECAKFRQIPSLWLGQVCPIGIEGFAQNMATQVAIELMGGQIVSLLIKGQKANPEKMIFIRADDELFFNAFDWNLFEAFLSGLYATYELKINRQVTEETHFTSTFQAMSFLDQYLFGKEAINLTENKKNDLRLINLDLTSLVDITHKKGTNQFYWNKFYQEFVNKLEIQTREKFKVFSYGVHCIGFLIDIKNLDYFFNELKEFARQFSYWKYFENSDGVLAQEVKPKVTMVPLSSYAYIKLAKHDIINNEMPNKKIDIKKRNNVLIWGRESIDEI